MTSVDARINYALYDKRLGEVTDRMRAGTASASDVAEARKMAVEAGLWTELSQEFARHFTDGYGDAPTWTPPVKAAPLPPIALGDLEAAVGKTVAIKLNRADGGTSVVVGKLHSVHAWGEGQGGLRFSELEPDLTARVQGKDDVPLGPIQGDLRIGQEITSVASWMPVDPGTHFGATAAKRGRVDVRRQAEAIIDGSWSPKVDLAPMRNGKVDQAYLDALKIERNALSAALIQPILQNIERLLAEEKPGPNTFNHKPIDHLQTWMFKRVDEEVTKVLADAAGKPDSPLGKAFARLSVVLELESQVAPHPKIASARTDPLAMIRVAAKTPMSIPFSMMRAVPELLGHAPSGTEARELVKSAVPSLMKLASSDMEVFLVHLEKWMEPGGQLGRFKAAALEITEKGLEFHKESMKEIASDLGVNLGTVMGATTGCPARLTVKNENRLPKIMELVAQQLGDAIDGQR